MLVIDEFEGIPDEVLSEVMHTFRKIYHQKERYQLHALMLVGVSTIGELVLSTASPFNIADDLPISYFSLAEVQDLIQQYIRETGQAFDPAVIQVIYENTQGQPGLVCTLCHYLVSTVVTDRTQPVTLSAFNHTLQVFLTTRLDKNIINIVQKAREKQDFMLNLLFRSEAIPFSLYEPDIAWLYANGVVDEVEGAVDIRVPLYKKVLLTAFRPLINGETDHYQTSAQESLSQYQNDEGGLEIKTLLDHYQRYVQRRGFRAFDTTNLREGACHYSLNGFINFYVEQLGGRTYLEVPSGKGRIDILIHYQNQSYVIETKVYSSQTNFKRGKGQLVAYLKAEGLTEGYYVVFSKLHGEDDDLYTEEVLEGKGLYTHIIPINFETPSRLKVPKSLHRSSG